ncbi:Imm1 family immunity protein [Actinokineospora sp.]|uniref:Imm1 family immunity protein n=1 Tax=Actinokineospora sp. TaxID=1872133 RepID=UPI004037FBE4
MTLTLWWDEEHGQTPVRVVTVQELYAALAAAQQVAPDGRVVVQAALDNGDVVEVGVNGDKGAVYYAGLPNGWYTMSETPSNEDSVSYSYMGNERSYPPNSELPIAVVRQVAAEFMTTGAQPTCVSWQPFVHSPDQYDDGF